MTLSPIQQYQAIVTALKAITGIKSVQRDVGQLDDPENTVTPVMPCILIKMDGTDWEHPTHEGNQHGSTVFSITLLTQLASIQSIDFSKNIDLSHEILFDNLHKKTLKIGNFKRFSNQEHTVVQFSGGLSLVTSAKYTSNALFENTDFYQVRTLRQLSTPSINAETDL
jgi:hypothetical protein